MKKIGIYGGTFDPIHLGHIKAAENVLKTLRLDLIIFVPAGMPPHKEGKYNITAGDRLLMCKLATENNPRFIVSDYEVRHVGKSYTYKTLEFFKREFPGDELFFIMGDEAYAGFSTWKKPETIRSLAKLIVVKRTGENLKDSDTVILVEEEPFIVSSSEVRNIAVCGGSLIGLVPQAVCEYIEKNNLYRSEKTK